MKKVVAPPAEDHPSAKDKFPPSATMHSAAQKGDLTVLRSLLEVSTAGINKVDQFSQTPLTCAAMELQVDAVRVLRDNGANIEATNKFGYTALHYAVSSKPNDTESQKRCELISLLASSSNVNLKVDGSTPLQFAMKLRGDINDIAWELLAKGATPTEDALSSAAATKRWRLVRILAQRMSIPEPSPSQLLSKLLGHPEPTLLLRSAYHMVYKPVCTSTSALDRSGVGDKVALVIKEKHLDKLCEWIQTNRTVKVLDLFDAPIKPDQLLSLQSALRYNVSLQRIVLPFEPVNLILEENMKLEYQGLNFSNEALLARFFLTSKRPISLHESNSQHRRDKLLRVLRLPQDVADFFVKGVTPQNQLPPYTAAALEVALNLVRDDPTHSAELHLPVLFRTISQLPESDAIRLAQRIYDMLVRAPKEDGMPFRDYLKNGFVGQDHVKERVQRIVNMITFSLTKPRLPRVLLFTGPSGVGKTYLAKLMGRHGRGGRLVKDELFLRYDMSSYASREHANSFTGSAVGYEGSAAGGQLVTDLLHLVERSRQSTTANVPVVLFDEFDRANPAVLDVLLALFAEGFISDASGPRRRVDCREITFICTTNAGQEEIVKMGENLRAELSAHSAEQLTVKAAIKAVSAALTDPKRNPPLSTALVARLESNVYMFLPFKGKEKNALVVTELRQLAKRIWEGASPGSCLVWSPSVVSALQSQLKEGDAGHQLGQITNDFEEKLTLFLHEKFSEMEQLPRLWIVADTKDNSFVFTAGVLPHLPPAPVLPVVVEAEAAPQVRRFQLLVLVTSLGHEFARSAVFGAVEWSEAMRHLKSESGCAVDALASLDVYDPQRQLWIEVVPTKAPFSALPSQGQVRLRFSDAQADEVVSSQDFAAKSFSILAGIAALLSAVSFLLVLWK